MQFEKWIACSNSNALCIIKTTLSPSLPPSLFLPGNEFTLERIIDIGLDQFSEVIGEISSAASKELAIEQVRRSGCRPMTRLGGVPSRSH